MQTPSPMIVFALALALTGSSSAETQFYYDTQHRLTRVVYDTGTYIKYEYDAAGNRTRRVHTITADISANGVVDLSDLDLLARDWLLTDSLTVVCDPGYENLVAKWDFDDGTADNNDAAIVGAGADGVLMGNAAIVHDAYLSSNVLSLPQNDSNDYIDCGGSKDSNEPDTWADLAGSFTLAAWIRQTQWRDWGCFMAKGEITYKLQLFVAAWMPDTVHFAFPRSTGGGMLSQSKLSTAQWYHVAGIWDNDEQIAYIYIDGELDAFTDWGSQYPQIPGTPVKNDCAVYIGARFNEQLTADRHGIPSCPCDPNTAGGAPAVGVFCGYLDDVRIYNRALLPGEIIFLAGRPAQTIYQPLTSIANIYDIEPQGQKTVNFKDFTTLAENWLKPMF